MINLTDMELCMLEQLTYLDEDVAAAAGVNDNFGKINTDMVDKTVSRILAVLEWLYNDTAMTRIC